MRQYVQLAPAVTFLNGAWFESLRALRLFTRSFSWFLSALVVSLTGRLIFCHICLSYHHRHSIIRRNTFYRTTLDKHKHLKQQFSEIRVQNDTSISVMRNSAILTYSFLSSTPVKHSSAADGPYCEADQSGLLLTHIFV
jgi:hypothetical protein